MHVNKVSHVKTINLFAKDLGEREDWLSVITRAFGSPKMPHTVAAGRKPETNSYPKAVGFASILVPSIIDAKFRPQPKCNIPRQCTGLSAPSAAKSPLDSAKTPSFLQGTASRSAVRTISCLLTFHCRVRAAERKKAGWRSKRSPKRR
jgi:hypothetical protein